MIFLRRLSYLYHNKAEGIHASQVSQLLLCIAHPLVGWTLLVWLLIQGLNHGGSAAETWLPWCVSGLILNHRTTLALLTVNC